MSFLQAKHIYLRLNKASVLSSESSELLKITNCKTIKYINKYSSKNKSRESNSFLRRKKVKTLAKLDNVKYKK